jgi:1-acyl-sn-glycerol-3-phosphate acyltransferase
MVRFPLLRPLFALCEYIALYFGLVFLGILFLLWNPVAIILRPLLPRAWARTVGRWAVTTGFRIYLGGLALTRACRFDLSALDALRGEPPLIIAPNHPGLIDAALVLSRLPATCIMKAELMRNLFLSPGAHLAGYIRNDTVHGMIVNSTASLRQGAHLLVFPEGTRTTRSPVNPFIRSVGIIARHAGVAVQTVFIDTDSPYLSKGWPLFRKPTFPITYRIRLGKRFDPPEKTREFVNELERYFAEELAKGSMMQTWLPAPVVPDEPLRA